jgi:hypothetical protein
MLSYARCSHCSLQAAVVFELRHSLISTDAGYANLAAAALPVATLTLAALPEVPRRNNNCE